MLANQIRPTTLSAAIVFRVHPFLAKKHRELPFLAIAQYLFPEIFYGRQEVHKYFCTSVNINGRFTWYVIPRLLHIKKCTDRPTVAAPKCQPSEDEPPDH